MNYCCSESLDRSSLYIAAQFSGEGIRPVQLKATVCHLLYTLLLFLEKREHKEGSHSCSASHSVQSDMATTVCVGNARTKLNVFVDSRAAV